MESRFPPRCLAPAPISCMSAFSSSNRLSSLLHMTIKMVMITPAHAAKAPATAAKATGIGGIDGIGQRRSSFQDTHHQRPRVGFPNTAAFMGNPPDRWVDLLRPMEYLVGNIPHKSRRRGILPDKIHHNSGKHRHNSQALFPHVGVDGCGDADIGNQAQRANHQELDQANE